MPFNQEIATTALRREAAKALSDASYKISCKDAGIEEIREDIDRAIQALEMGQPAPEGDTHIILDAEDYERWRLRWKQDRDDQDAALRDAIRETALTADELAFWRYQAIFARAYMLRPAALHSIDFEDGPEWKEAERQLEANRAAENRERSAHAEAPRDPGGT